MSSNTDPVQKFPSVQAPQPFTQQRWRPKPFQDPELDLSTKTLYDNVYGLEATATQAVKALQGSKISSGAIAVTGNMKGVATGLGTLSNIVVSIDAGSTPTNMIVTATPSTITAGTFDVYVWNSSSPANAVVRWLAWGT
jgi:hypothetical protein